MFSEADHHWMQLALEQAKLAECADEVPVGAVLVKDDQLIAAAHNHSIQNHDPTAHAEIMLLRKAGQALTNYRLLDTTLYVTLEPCAMCANAIVHARVARLVYGASDRKTGAVESCLQSFNHTYLNHQVIYQAGCMAEPCGEVLSNFFKRKRQKVSSLRGAKRPGNLVD